MSVNTLSQIGNIAMSLAGQGGVKLKGKDVDLQSLFVTAGRIGTQTSNGKPNVLSAMGSAAQGASLGAKLGSLVPGIGTAIGAAIGAGVGFLSKLIGQKTA